jgi:voltage-gated potassium channel Kch
MSLTPFLGQAGDALGQWLQGAIAAGPASDAEAGAPQQQSDDDAGNPGDAEADGIVVCGFGNVGQGICRVVSKHMEGYSGPFVCFDLNPARIAEGALSGQPVVYGDGASPKVLRSAGVVKPRVIIMAYNNLNVRLAGLRQLRLAFPGVPIISRARAPKEREALMEAGATSVLFESEEVAVQLSQAVFSEVGKRLDVDSARLSIQDAANLARRDEGHDIDADLDLLAMDSGFSRQEVIRLYRIFESADLDGNGEIDPFEAEEIIARASDIPMSQADFQEYMNILDADNSGRVCFEDFLSVYARGCVPGEVPARTGGPS